MPSLERAHPAPSAMRAVVLCTLALVVLTAVCVSAQYTPAAQADKITSLPGLATMPTFNMFSGYLVVDAATNKSIFYWYVESQNQPTTDPLFWWSNGGPGCSGLLGLLTEHGPFRPSPQVDNSTGLEVFDYSWNRVANMLYVEAPAGVGFSFSDDPQQYTTDDAQTAQDNLVSLQQFFIRFPHLTANDFYISAESYGGHYIPQLALLLLPQAPTSNFRGFLVGNPLVDVDENMLGMCGTVCGHALASEPTCRAWTEQCPQTTACGMSESSERARFEVNHCTAAQNQVLAEAGNTMLYGLDFPQCATMSEKKQLLRHILRDRLRALPPSTHRSEFRSRLLAEDAGRACQDADEPPFDMCSIPEASTYLNRADVRSALHVSSKAAAVWMGCSQTLNYSVTDPNVAQEGYYQQVIEMSKESGANLRLLVMSGDDDAVCGTLGTQSWMDSRFGGSIIEPWQPWRYDSEEYGQQIGGFVVQFDGISLATVHGAGHMCATYQPEKTFALVQRFLSGSLTTVA